MIKLKKYRLCLYANKKIWVIPVIETYCSNNTLAIELFTKKKESFAMLTVNLKEKHSDPDNKALCFLDVNNYDWAELFVVENGLGHSTGFYGGSGFCAYPEYEIDLSKLNTGV